MSQQINLFNPAFRRARRRAAALLIAVTAVAVIIAGATAGYEQYRLRQTRIEAQALGARLKQAQTRYDRVAAERGARKPDTAREAELVELLGQVKRRQDIVTALKGGVLGTSTGFSEFMRAFARQSLDGVWLTGFEIDAGGRELALSGRALDADLVPRYLERLNRESLLQGRQFSSVRVEQRVVERAPLPPPPPRDKDGDKDKEKAKDARAEKVERPPLRYMEFSMSTSIRDAKAPAPPPPSVRPAPIERPTDSITSDSGGVRLKIPAPPGPPK